MDSEQISPEDDAAVRALHAAYWARTDGRDPAPPEALFSEDAVFELGNLKLSGREEIDAFFQKRRTDQEASGRITRHLATNLTLRQLHDGRIATSSVVMAIAGFGPLPVTSTAPSIADFEDICVRQPDGRWLFQQRTAISIFAGPEAPGFARSLKTSEEE